MATTSIDTSNEADPNTLRVLKILKLITVIVVVATLYDVIQFQQSFSSNPDGDTSTRRANDRVNSNPPISPRYQTGSWLGDTWIPPKGWYLHTTEEIQETFRGRSILWIGDSTARRAGASLYAILNHTNNTPQSENQTKANAVSVFELDDTLVIDVNRKEKTEHCTRHNWNKARGKTRPNFCRPMPDNPNHEYIAFRICCFFELEEFFRGELEGKTNYTSYVDLIIVGAGIWYAANPGTQGYCRHNQTNPHTAQLPGLLQALDQLQAQRPDLTILWRTCGFAQDQPDLHTDTTIPHEINDYVMNYVDTSPTNISYVHWGGAIEPRSFGKDRLEGDIEAHYNLQARIVLLQMIANTLNDKTRHSVGGTPA